MPLSRRPCPAALRRYQKLQGRLKEEKRAAKLLRAQLAEERAARAELLLERKALPCVVGLDLSASNLGAPPQPPPFWARWRHLFWGWCSGGAGSPGCACAYQTSGHRLSCACPASRSLPPLPWPPPAADSDYRLPALLLADLSVRSTHGVWVLEAGPDYLCLGADNKLYQVCASVQSCVQRFRALLACLGPAQGLGARLVLAAQQSLRPLDQAGACAPFAAQVGARHISAICPGTHPVSDDADACASVMRFAESLRSRSEHARLRAAGGAAGWSVLLLLQTAGRSQAR